MCCSLHMYVYVVTQVMFSRLQLSGRSIGVLKGWGGGVSSHPSFQTKGFWSKKTSQMSLYLLLPVILTLYLKIF